MKKTALFSIAIAVSVLLHAQQPSTKDQQEVQQTVINFFEALSNRDSVSLKNHCTPDIVLFEYGGTWNADTLIRKAIRSNTAADFKRLNRFDFIRTTVTENTAWTTYYLHSEITTNGKQATVQWMETVITVKENKRWKIKVLHSTLLKRS
ncbi:MAG: nuclear transport factor 2 family protein [Ferruginibacter sp.]|nr:nuclear transport factor 2 family protein [Chitinophagaceae bacterium]MBU9935729.1 nuclear transport factor 2 family protein [Ferruginibacter sp.]